MTTVSTRLLEHHERSHFARALRRRMSACHLDAYRLHQTSGVAFTSIKNYLRGRQRPSARSLDRLCLVLGEELAHSFRASALCGEREEMLRASSVGSEMIVDLHARMPLTTFLELVEWLDTHGIYDSESRPANDQSGG